VITMARSPTKINDAAVAAIAESYYARETASPDAARARAQAAHGIAGGVAGGLVAAAVLTRLASLQTPVQLLGVLSIALWLFATSLYLYAVGVPVEHVRPTSEELAPPPSRRERRPPAAQAQDVAFDDTPARSPGSAQPPLRVARGGAAFTQRVIRAAIHERSTVDRRQRRANIASLVAMTATVVTFSLAFLLPATTFEATIVMLPNADAATPCLRDSQEFEGQVVAATLQSSMVEIHHATLCGDEFDRVYIDQRRIAEIRVR
jgi:hypothetical protein